MAPGATLWNEAFTRQQVAESPQGQSQGNAETNPDALRDNGPLSNSNQFIYALEQR
jgi:hypothetical protein